MCFKFLERRAFFIVRLLSPCAVQTRMARVFGSYRLLSFALARSAYKSNLLSYLIIMSTRDQFRLRLSYFSFSLFHIRGISMKTSTAHEEK